MFEWILHFMVIKSWEGVYDQCDIHIEEKSSVRHTGS